MVNLCTALLVALPLDRKVMVYRNKAVPVIWFAYDVSLVMEFVEDVNLRCALGNVFAVCVDLARC